MDHSVSQSSGLFNGPGTLEPEIENLMNVVTSLSFHGRTEQALKFYETSLGAKTLYLMRFCESPIKEFTDSEFGNLIFHATFQIEETILMASDVGHDDPDSDRSFSGFALSLRPDSVAQAVSIFANLANEGEVIIPLAESRFTRLYGIVQDPFGLTWKINVSHESD